MRIIGLTGVAGSGKDTVADILCKRWYWEKLSLAQPIREGLKAMFDLTDDDLADRYKKEKVIRWIGKSPRELMQTLGTEWGRNQVCDDVWFKILARQIESLDAVGEWKHVGGVVITDVRFVDEAERLRETYKERFSLWRVVRSNSGLKDKTATHPSETSQIPDEWVDCMIDNNGTIVNLVITVKELVC